MAHVRSEIIAKVVDALTPDVFVAGNMYRNRDHAIQADATSGLPACYVAADREVPSEEDLSGASNKTFRVLIGVVGSTEDEAWEYERKVLAALKGKEVELYQLGVTLQFDGADFDSASGTREYHLSEVAVNLTYRTLDGDAAGTA